MNQARTIVLLAVLTALLMWAGQTLAGKTGLWVTLVFAAAMNIGSYWFADKIVLRMHDAKEVSIEQAPDLYAIVRALAARAALPMPRVYIIQEEAPNAYATGRNPKNGVVAVTSGLLRVLDQRELAAVIAHELGHIRHRDTLIMAIAATFAGALSVLSNAALFGSLWGAGRTSEEDNNTSPLTGLLGVLIAPLAATLVQMSISRTREFLADEAAARYTGTPLALASALRKIETWNRALPMEHGSPATAHLYIQNPFGAEGLARLFHTHPPTEQRIARLKRMAAGNLPAAA